MLIWQKSSTVLNSASVGGSARRAQSRPLVTRLTTSPNGDPATSVGTSDVSAQLLRPRPAIVRRIAIASARVESARSPNPSVVASPASACSTSQFADTRLPSRSP